MFWLFHCLLDPLRRSSVYFCWFGFYSHSFILWNCSCNLTFCAVSRRSAYILKPSSLPKSYVSFLNKQAGKATSVIKGIKEVALNRRPLTSLKDIEDHYRSTGVDIKLDPEMTTCCTVSPRLSLFRRHYVVSYVVYFWYFTSECNVGQRSGIITISIWRWWFCRLYMVTKDVCPMSSLTGHKHTCGHCQFIFLYTWFLHLLCIGRIFLQGESTKNFFGFSPSELDLCSLWSHTNIATFFACQTFTHFMEGNTWSCEI